MSRHELMQCQQEANELTYGFPKRLKQIIKQCEYDPIVEYPYLVDVLIFGMHLKSTLLSFLNQRKDQTIAETKDQLINRWKSSIYHWRRPMRMWGKQTMNMCKPTDSVVETTTSENDQQSVKHVLH